MPDVVPARAIVRPRVTRADGTVPLLLEARFQAPEDVRKANLRRCDLRGALLDPPQLAWLRRCRAILDPGP